MIRMFSSTHAYFMNSAVGEKQKAKAKGNLVSLNQKNTRMGFGTVHGPHNPSKHGFEDAESTLSVLHCFQGKIWECIIHQHPDVCGKVIAYGYCSENHINRI
jgi:hypothetical protein